MNIKPQDKLKQAQAAYQQTIGLLQQGQIHAAREYLQQALAAYPQGVPLWRLAVMIYANSGALTPAEHAARRVIELEPSAQAYYDLGLVLQRQQRWPEAETAQRQALNLNPRYSEAYNNLGLILHAQHRFDEALAAYRQALQYNPGYARAYLNSGVTLMEQNQLADAAQAQRQAIHLQPDLLEAYTNLVGVLKKQRQYPEALQVCQQILQRKPGMAEIYVLIASILIAQGKVDQALSASQEAVRLKPDSAEAHHCLAEVLRSLQRPQQALLACQEALRFKPDWADAYLTLASILEEHSQLDQVVHAYREALRLNPNLLNTTGLLTYALQRLGCWAEWQPLAQQVIQAITENREGGITPFSFLSLSDDPALQQRCARMYARQYSEYTATTKPLPYRHHKKIRIGYLSANFRDHPTSYNSVAIFELHDRQQFEVFGYAERPDDGSVIRARVAAAFDHFEEVSALSVTDTAARIRADEIDILVNLGGHIEYSRPAILATRPAPIQVQYLSYPGTLGMTDALDYLIADPVVIPSQYFKYYDESVVWLPDTYWPSDRQRSVAPPPSRAAEGLPEQGLVWCCFNNAYKITPDFFTLWMRLLQAVPDSVLWLLASNPWMADNLRRAAEERGVDRQRLVFAGIQPNAEHVGRIALADLILDTLPYGAHTTLSDALWAGVPVLTCCGTSFVGRVGASLLHAAGVPELITNNLAEYEARALTLATDPAQRNALKQRLRSQRDRHAFFDSPRFVRHLEHAYQMMQDRICRGLPPTHLQVPSIID